MREERLESNAFKGVVAGIIGGLVASWAMGKYQTMISALSENQQSPPQIEANREEPANVQAAEAISTTVFDHELTKTEKDPAGEAAHYVMGATSGAIYGVMAEIITETTIAGGLPFGAIVWFVADNIAVPALGLSKSPTKFPIQTHA
ncbi:MAG: DUF1440 domain-containing protein, partial [Pyrinomonadaceae bacterium]|nr:DUF1440 domain-containing protein [Pyrinomonadaceae bacterium]